jgi:DNA-directed RNA polymerase subunit RPC12/RpoP
MPVFCTNCGSQIVVQPNGIPAKFCSDCGTAVSQVVSQPVISSSSSEKQEVVQENKSQSQRPQVYLGEVGKQIHLELELIVESGF